MRPKGAIMTDQLEPAVRTLIDAANAGNTDAFLSGFTADGVVDDWGREFRGAGGIRSWSDSEFIGRRVSLAVRSVAARGGRTEVIADVGGGGFNGPSTFSFEVDGDRVDRMTIRA